MTTMGMRGKVVLVTGATSGLGKVTALELARLGAQVVCLARDRTRGLATVEEVKRQSGNSQVELLVGDLSSVRSIRQIAAEFRARHSALHVLINNAGIIAPKRELTPEGYELTFAVNHLAYFALTDLLLDTLKAGAPARIVNVASEAQRAGHIDFDDIHAERRFSPMRTYMQSKLANVMFTLDLAERLQGTGVTANAVHPGPVNTNWAGTLTGPFKWGMTLFRPFMLTPQKGAETIVYLASSPEVEGVSGKYFTKKKPIRPSREARDPRVRRQLWELTERLTSAAHGSTGLGPPEQASATAGS